MTLEEGLKIAKDAAMLAAAATVTVLGVKHAVSGGSNSDQTIVTDNPIKGQVRDIAEARVSEFEKREKYDKDEDKAIARAKKVEDARKSIATTVGI